MPLRKRVYVINIPPGLPLEKVYEKLSKALDTPQGEIKLEHGRAVVKLVGLDSEMKSSWLKIKQAVAELWEIYNLRKTMQISVETLVKEVRRTFSPEALVYALRLRGYEAELLEGKGVIRTNAPFEEIVDAARLIVQTVDEVKYTLSGTASKRVVAALASGLRLPPSTVIEYGLRSKIFKNSQGKVTLAMDWRVAIRRLAVLLKGALTNKGGGGKESGSRNQDT
ncbi:MAG: DUF2067 family protein [Thermoproteota archaeon]